MVLNVLVLVPSCRRFMRQIWDTAGQERFHSLTTSFFKRAEGFVLVYDVSNRQSFESVSTWMKDIVEVIDIQKL